MWLLRCYENQLFQEQNPTYFQILKRLVFSVVPSNEWALIGFLPVASQKNFKKTAGSEEKKYNCSKAKCCDLQCHHSKQTFQPQLGFNQNPKEKLEQKAIPTSKRFFYSGLQQIMTVMAFPTLLQCKSYKTEKQVNLFPDLELNSR